MIGLLGRYNHCNVYTNVIDEATMSQLMALLNQHSVEGSKIRIMPDCHAGAGCVIGTTMTLKDKVIPNLVGVDIGCGMLATRLAEHEISFEKLDDVIRNSIPSGFDVHSDAISSSHVDQIRAPIKLDYALRSLGTLGGGNHFIEVDKDSNEDLWLVIHTGSRHLGVEVCNYYQNLAWKRIQEFSLRKPIDAAIEELKRAGREIEIESVIRTLKADRGGIPKDLSYVEGTDFEDYIHDMKLAQEHAKINRKTISEEILSRMKLHAIESFDTIHNYIDTHYMILRKGAISAQRRERVLIPMNMRDGSLICIGKGNPDWNYSAPHGAGRIMSRGAAKETVSMDEFRDSMEGIYSTSVTESTIDESPMVYKPMQSIIDNIAETVEIVDIIKPVYNFKAS